MQSIANLLVLFQRNLDSVTHVSASFQIICISVSSFFNCKDFHVNFDIHSMSVSCISLSLMSVSPRIMIIPSLRVDCPASPREFWFSFPGQRVDFTFNFREFRFSVPFHWIPFPLNSVLIFNSKSETGLSFPFSSILILNSRSETWLSCPCQGIFDCHFQEVWGLTEWPFQEVLLLRVPERLETEMIYLPKLFNVPKFSCQSHMFFWVPYLRASKFCQSFVKVWSNFEIQFQSFIKVWSNFEMLISNFHQTLML